MAAQAIMDAEPTDEAAVADETGALHAHRLRYRELFEFSADGHVVTDGEGVIVEANHAAAAVLKCPKEFLAGKPLGLFVTEGHRSRFYASLARLHSGLGSDEFETKVGQRGEPRNVAVRVIASDIEPGAATAFRWLLTDTTDRRRAEAARDDLLRRLVTAQEDERRRVSRELHDSIGQLLTALLLSLRGVRDAGPLSEAALVRLIEAQGVADELGRAAHDLAVRLRPTALDDVGLEAALRQYLHDWSVRYGVEVQFEAAGLGDSRFPPEIETSLYRVVQEALTNVVKHASARVVSVVLERQDGRAIAVVEDDGRGFDPEAAQDSGRLGLIGMRERVSLFGGELSVESSPGAGATIIARVPLARAGRDEERDG